MVNGQTKVRILTHCIGSFWLWYHWIIARLIYIVVHIACIRVLTHTRTHARTDAHTSDNSNKFMITWGWNGIHFALVICVTQNKHFEIKIIWCTNMQNACPSLSIYFHISKCECECECSKWGELSEHTSQFSRNLTKRWWLWCLSTRLTFSPIPCKRFALRLVSIGYYTAYKLISLIHSLSLSLSSA